MTAEQRNLEIRRLTARFLDLPASSSRHPLPPQVDSKLRKVFESQNRSYRDLLMTVIVSRLRDPSYTPSTSLYSAKPRSVFEKGIRPELEARSIPCTQSGPLNVAKAAARLDLNWAAQRRPADVANALLEVVGFLETGTEAEVESLAQRSADLLVADAKAVAGKSIEVSPTQDPAKLATVAIELIDAAPSGGNTPQRVCGAVLLALHPGARIADRSASAVSRVACEVFGVRDSASQTNLTSGKPGDMGLSCGGVPTRIYEVTIKSFGQQRISECTQSVLAYNETAERGSGQRPIQHVYVLCRREDVPETAGRSPWLPRALGRPLSQTDPSRTTSLTSTGGSQCHSSSRRCWGVGASWVS